MLVTKCDGCPPDVVIYYVLLFGINIQVAVQVIRKSHTPNLA